VDKKKKQDSDDVRKRTERKYGEWKERKSSTYTIL